MNAYPCGNNKFKNIQSIAKLKNVSRLIILQFRNCKSIYYVYSLVFTMYGRTGVDTSVLICQQECDEQRSVTRCC